MRPSTDAAIGYPTNRLLVVIDDPAEAAGAAPAGQRALRDRHAVIILHGDATKVTAREVLRRHGCHVIDYHGRFATEELDMWRGPEPDIPGYLRR